jgi:hypothetical protein
MTRTFLAISALLTLWGGGIIWLAQQGAFHQAPGMPPVRIVLAIAVPVALALVAWRISPALRTWVRGLDPALIAGVQTWRVMGIVFVFFWWAGQLPTIFAWAATLGDVAVGVFALGVTLAVARGVSGWQTQMRWLVVFGLADFAMVLVLGTLSGAGRPLAFAAEPLPVAMQDLPMILIPGFAVPVFVILLLMAMVLARATATTDHRAPVPA